MTELQAALGVSQIQRLDKFVKSRHILQERYDAMLYNLPVLKPIQDSNCYSSLHLYPVQVALDSSDKDRQKIFIELRKNGIGVNVHYIPIHQQPFYQKFGFREGSFPCAEGYYRHTISLPLFHTMTFDQQDQVVSVLKKSLQICQK